MYKNIFLLLFIFIISSPINVFSEKKQPKTKVTKVEPTQTQQKITEEVAKQIPETEKITEVIIEGVVKEIAKDKSYIIVDETKIFTTKEFLEENYIEVDDKIKITAQKEGDNLKAISCDYPFDEELSEEIIPEEEILE